MGEVSLRSPESTEENVTPQTPRPKLNQESVTRQSPEVTPGPFTHSSWDKLTY